MIKKKLEREFNLQLLAHTAQERYSDLVLSKLRKTAVFTGLFNQRYEGTPTAGAVKIPVRDEVKVGDYNKKTGGTISEGSTTYVTLPIDKDKYVNELVDGFDAESVPDNLVADRLDSAGYSMGIALDTDLISLLTTKGTASSNTTPLTEATIYNSVVDEVAALKKKGLRPEEMWIAVTNETFALIVKSPEFIKASELGDNVVQNGRVGRINGVDVYETNNIPDSSNVEYIIGNKVYCHFVDEWLVPVAINDLKDGEHIGASAVQGRRVYGMMVSKTDTVTLKKKA